MFRSLKKASIQFGLAKGDETDAHYKRKLKHVVDTTANLRAHVTSFIKAHSDAIAAMNVMHETFRYFYPEDQPLRPKIDTLAVRAGAFRATKDTLEVARAELDTALNAVLNKEREVLRMVEDRERLRIDIQHFEAQLPKLRERAAKHPRDQIALDETTAKRNATQIMFDELEARLVPDLLSFDDDVAKLVDAAIGKWFDAEKLAHSQCIDLITEAQGASVSPIKEALAAAATAPAGGPAEDSAEPSADAAADVPAAASSSSDVPAAEPAV